MGVSAVSAVPVILPGDGPLSCSFLRSAGGRSRLRRWSQRPWTGSAGSLLWLGGLGWQR